MTTLEIPITTYSVQEKKPTTPFGSPAALPTSNEAGKRRKILARIPLDQIPLDATISSAVVEFQGERDVVGANLVLRAYTNPTNFTASVTYAKRPTGGTLVTSQTKTDPVRGTLWQLNVTPWASTIPRVRTGLTIDTNSVTAIWLRGSAAAVGKPVLRVVYTVPPLDPSTLKPSGGAVSVPDPVLTYAGDPDMTEQWVEYSTAGTAASVVYRSGWLPATRGRYNPSNDLGTGAGVFGAKPNLAVGGQIYWRVKTRGPDGESDFSGWMSYSYQPVTDPQITHPLALTDDGSPPLMWDVASQTSWKADLFGPEGLIESSGWRDEPDTRIWSPTKGVQVPDGHGRYVLNTQDAVLPRVAAEDAPTWGEDYVEFDTVLSGDAQAVNTLEIDYDEPTSTFYGSRSLGVPDEIALVRDGQVVPFWSEDGDQYLWAPGYLVFEGNDFVMRDYTANLRHEHTWNIRTRSDGVMSAVGPRITRKFSTSSVWLVDPSNGDRVEIFGANGKPVVDQGTVEAAALHTPVNGALRVETVRRRLSRSTRSGSISGMVVNDAEDILAKWAERDSSHRYRLIFGKVNWPVIIGDYDPTDVFYVEECGDDMVLFTLNWWERLRD
jgi:hypothetical protein